jgi:tetratricopeptide (TPR) repeat protein
LAELRDYYEDPVDLDAARHWYQRVIDDWPDLPIAGEATLRLAATFVQTYDPAQVRHGVELVETWLATREDEPLAAGMWQYLGDTYFYPLADHETSLRCYRKAEAIGFLDSNNVGTLCWRMAILAERFLEDRDRAVEYYGKVIRSGAASGKGYQAQLALERLGAPVPELRLFQPVADVRPVE